MRSSQCQRPVLTFILFLSGVKVSPNPVFRFTPERITQGVDCMLLRSTVNLSVIFGQKGTRKKSRTHSWRKDLITPISHSQNTKQHKIKVTKYEIKMMECAVQSINSTDNKEKGNECLQGGHHRALYVSHNSHAHPHRGRRKSQEQENSRAKAWSPAGVWDNEEPGPPSVQDTALQPRVEGDPEHTHREALECQVKELLESKKPKALTLNERQTKGMLFIIIAIEPGNRLYLRQRFQFFCSPSAMKQDYHPFTHLLKHY